MWEAYRIGVCAGGGTALGIAAAGLLRRPLLAAAVAGALAAVLAGLILGWIGEAIGAAVGGLVGGSSASTVAAGSLRRGGTAGGTATLFLLAAVGVFALALVPFVGYLEPLALAAFAARARRRAGEKYAGLRSLAK
jgi:hypothetical protein